MNDSNDIKAKILDIEADVKAVMAKACSIDAGVYLESQGRAIRRLQLAIREVDGWHIGEVKNEFGIGIKQKLSKKQ